MNPEHQRRNVRVAKHPNEGGAKEQSIPEGGMLEDGVSEGLAQLLRAGLAVLAEPGQMAAQVHQELVVGGWDTGRLQDRPQPLAALLHSLTLCRKQTKTTAANKKTVKSMGRGQCFASLKVAKLFNYSAASGVFFKVNIQ